ncbi:MAG: hypothetical protein WCC74_01045 [Minisyncoccia bacterium]
MKFWKDWPYWEKGGGVGFSISILMFLTAYLANLIFQGGERIITLAVSFPGLILGLLFTPSLILTSSPFWAYVAIIIFSSITYFIFGSIVGWIYGNIKNRKKINNLTK